MAVRFTAPAKVNLYLHVTGRRPDGLHALDSVFVFTELADRVTARPAARLSLRVTGDHARAVAEIDSEANLVLVAARRLAAEAGERGYGAALELEKTVPVAAGLGGGSADAAAALKACAKLWGLNPPRERLIALAMSVGADVPACLAGQPVHVGGAGERVKPLAGSPQGGILLVNPGRALATAQVFAAFRGRGEPFSAPLEDPGGWSDPRWLQANTRNDLEPAAISLAPEIGDVLTDLRALDGVRLARMSGSGATCFALFDTVRAAEAAAGALAKRRPGWWRWAGGFAQ